MTASLAMRNGSENGSGAHAISWQLRFALARSDVRRRVLAALARESPLYVAEIARLTALSHGNVLGALLGKGRRFAKSSSLVDLRMAEEVAAEGRPVHLFRITMLGARMATTLPAPRMPSQGWTEDGFGRDPRGFSMG